MATLLPDGRWQARYRPQQGKAKTWHSRESAEDAEKQKQQYLDSLESSGSYILSTADTLLQDYAKRAWWPSVEASCKDTTQKKYEDAWRLHVRPEFGGIPLGKVTYEHVQHWAARMRKDGVSLNEIRMRRAVLSMVLNLAVKTRIIPANPAGLVKIAKPPKRVRVMTVPQALAVLRAVEGTNMHAPVFLALVLGMSRGEACGLKWESVDEATNRVTVCEQRRRRRTGKFRIDQTDTKRESRVRSYVLPSPIFDMLMRIGNQESGWVCTSRGRRPWNPEKMSEKWGVTADKLGIGHFTFHDLRHVTAGLLVSMNVDLLTVASILGHASIDTTMLYSHAQDAMATRGFEGLAKALFSST